MKLFWGVLKEKLPGNKRNLLAKVEVILPDPLRSYVIVLGDSNHNFFQLVACVILETVRKKCSQSVIKWQGRYKRGSKCF